MARSGSFGRASAKLVDSTTLKSVSDASLSSRSFERAHIATERIEYKRNLHGLQNDLSTSASKTGRWVGVSRLATSKMTSLFDLVRRVTFAVGERFHCRRENQKAVGSRRDRHTRYFLGDGITSLHLYGSDIVLHTLDITSERLTGLLKTLYEEINLLIANADT